VANLWYSDVGERSLWQHVPVPDDSRYVLVDNLPRSVKPRVSSRRRLRSPRPDVPGTERFLLVRVGAARSERWFAVRFPHTRLLVNGRAVPAGLTGLSDRDIIGFDAECGDLVFTTERKARIENYVGASGNFCPRCKLELERDQRIVVCPSCRTIHHQDEPASLPCWTYAGTCNQCDHQTRLDLDTFSWTPDEL